MQNPFLYGKPVLGSDFCPRLEIEKKVEKILLSKGSLYLSGKHKIGKTSLIKHISDKIKNTHYLIHIDCRMVEDIAGIEKKIIQALLDAESNFTDFKSILQKYAKYSPTMKLDHISGLVAFNVPTKKNIELDDLKQALSYVKICNNLKPIIFFDNIQELAKISDKNIMETLLNSLEENKESITIFSESEDLFKEKLSFKSCFDKITDVLTLDEIPLEEYLGFVQEKFKQRQINIPNHIGQELLKMSGGLTGERQLVFSSLWEVCSDGDTVDTIKVSQTLNNIFEKYQELYMALFEDLTPLQKRVLKLLAHDEDSKIYSKSFGEKVGQTANNTVVKIIQALSSRRLIYKQDSNYKFLNPFLREWIKINFPI